MKDGALPLNNGSAIIEAENKSKEEAKSKILELLEKHELDIESLGQNINQIKLQLDQLPQVIQNAVVNVIQGIQANALQAPVMEAQQPSSVIASQPKSNYAALLQDPQIMGSVVEKILGKILGSDAAPSNFLGLDEEELKRQMRESVMSNFELGSSLVEAVKSGFKRKTVGKMVQNVVEHGIE